MWADKIKAFTTWTLSIAAGSALAVGAAVLASGHTTTSVATPSSTAPSTTTASHSAPTPPSTSGPATSDMRSTDGETGGTVPISTPTSPRPVETPTTVVHEPGDDGGSNEGEHESEHEHSGGYDD